MRFFRPALILLSLAIPFLASAQSPTLPAADQTAIRAVLDRQIEAWNHHDMRAYVADMTPDVEWINIVGMRWRGRDDVYTAHEKYHETIFKTRKLSPWTTVDIRAITPDVAVVTAIGDGEGFTGSDGRVFPPSTSILTYVLIHRDGRWLIAEAHNTTVDPHAAKNNPIHH
jgi:uncharacterized protein (TIGR02246 family)